MIVLVGAAGSWAIYKFWPVPFVASGPFILPISELIPSRTRRFPQVDNRRIPQDTSKDTTKDTPKVTSIITHRLSPEAYAELERVCPGSIVNNQTTETSAAFQLGVQHVLAILRRGFVVGA